MSVFWAMKVQVHGSDAGLGEDATLFFLPHQPHGEILESPLFLFMRGTGKKQLS